MNVQVCIYLCNTYMLAYIHNIYIYTIYTNIYMHAYTRAYMHAYIHTYVTVGNCPTAAGTLGSY